MKLSLIASAFLALAGILPAKAQEYRVNGMNKHVFLVTVFSGRMGHGVGTGATFCPAKNDVFESCGGFLKSGGFTPFFHNFWTSTSGQRRFNIAFAHGKLKAPAGRYYFTGQSVGNRYYGVGNITYFADISPGTVVVYPQGGIPMDEAIAYIKEQMVAQLGKKAQSLRYVPGGAVSVSCDNRPHKLSCKIGKQTSLSKVSFR
ncbi:hypothetical protein RA19_05440 [Leisingera sp. ANG-M1]|uniref:hypothetical protein n=1 Tax=Leisingera sp. ANG-M1 TaxID=1577895 RepID=UPI00057EF15C|nr:hypothetical protein [Leisingera sp. ANG-M1]KIC11487.1 hypothetical protein RA19_05440 [Leisingera sp. ANG-M1]